jgi:hypothetical protein
MPRSFPPEERRRAPKIRNVNRVDDGPTTEPQAYPADRAPAMVGAARVHYESAAPQRQIDLTGTAQTASNDVPNPFANDHTLAWTQCLD